MWCRPPEQFNYPPMMVRRLGHLTRNSSKQQRRRISEKKILHTLSEEDRNRYSAPTAALELRFGDEHLKKVFVAQVKTRIQKVGESLQEFAADVKKLVRLAYTEAPQTIQERLVTETFVDGIRDVKVRKVLQPSRHQTSFILCLKLCAGSGGGLQFFKSVAETEKEENNKIEKLLEKLLRQIDELFRRRENDVSRNQSVECYRSGRQGHLKRDCRAR
ncbi:hypothetical protein Zmor_020845 [Zophobas morio]|uniref:CCHC-type domain-containing protein n=1 Tax=Zophobas morio TaxID=2755281 RepID=A0AA38I4B6_9CUCU|nr:hypothetical protein Zmor_020845 [Zophobas morio]